MASRKSKRLASPLTPDSPSDKPRKAPRAVRVMQQFEQCGRSFQKVFARPFIHRLTIPTEFVERFRHELLPEVKIYGDCEMPYNVVVAIDGEGLVLKDGWRQLVVRGSPTTTWDCSFSWNRTSSICVYTHAEASRSLSARPVAVDDDDDDDVGVPVSSNKKKRNAVVSKKKVPPFILGMKFEFGPNVHISEAPGLMQQMVDVWVKYNPDHPIYACRLTDDNIKSGTLIFTNHYSEQLHLHHDQQSEVDLFFGDAGPVSWAKMCRVVSKPGNYVRIHSGFAKIISTHHITKMDILVVCVLRDDTRFRLRFFKIAG